MKLTQNQKLAIAHHAGNLQLIACAGSGKTEVVAQRVVHLLTPKTKGGVGLLPRNIMAFTFTEKAAAELKDRIMTRCREALSAINAMAEMYVGTIHAFCLDLLKTEVPKFLKYEVLNEVQQVLFTDRNSRKSGLTTSTDINGKALERYRDTGNYLQALSILRESDTVENSLKGCSILNGLDDYNALLEEHSYLDYSGILEEAIAAITNDKPLRQRLAERLRYVIVDEYQDVNPIQEAIVWSLHELGAKVCVVGDDDQTIYQWRGSDVQNILDFEKRYPKVKQIKLEENFRSSKGIVETARDFIAQNATRLPKAMVPTKAQVFEDGDIVALSFADPEEEAQYIVDTIKALHGAAFEEDGKSRGLAWSDMAILLRSVRKNGAPIFTALRQAGVPCIVAGMNNLFETAEAQAARMLFYFLADRPDVKEGDVRKAWKGANLGIAPAALDKAIEEAKATKASLAAAAERFGFYSIQRTFLTFLEKAGLREEKVPKRGEIVFYNLGKFSQLISDFEAIHFHSNPMQKYESFANFLQYHADEAYPEGWLDTQYANPDAVRIMTVHQAKGMQWPVVFIPALIRNRFPARKTGGRSVWHLLPAAGVKGQQRFVGTTEDERRLFYVAMTRSQKFLHMTWAPIPGNKQAQRASEFWDNVLVSPYVKRRPQNYAKRKKLPAQAKTGITRVAFSFSDLKYFFECPYQFKLRILYGFNAPIAEALGYGKSLHDALAEVHARAQRKDYASPSEAADLVATHLHAPYAYAKLKEQLEASAEKVIANYIKDNRKDFDKIEFSEKQVEIDLGDGITVAGRIDLVRRIDTGETTIVDLKSNDRAQPEQVTEIQLHTYALGYQELTGRRPDKVEIYELDERKRKPRSVDNDFIDDVKMGVRDAATALRAGTLIAKPDVKKCSSCDYCGLCSAGAKAVPARAA